jgi:hypothetical protein
VSTTTGTVFSRIGSRSIRTLGGAHLSGWTWGSIDRTTTSTSCGPASGSMPDRSTVAVNVSLDTSASGGAMYETSVTTGRSPRRTAASGGDWGSMRTLKLFVRALCDRTSPT